MKVRASVVVWAAVILSMPFRASAEEPAPGAAKSESSDAYRPVWLGPSATDLKNRTIFLGINLPQHTNDQLDSPFVDLFKSAVPWRSLDDRPLDLDRDGWVRTLAPGQTAATTIHIPRSEIYLVTYEGSGLLRIRGATGVSSGFVLEAIGGETVELAIESTEASDPLRNIRVIPSRLEQAVPMPVFDDDVVRRLGHFSVIRFAAWMRGADSSVVEWNDRARPEDATQVTPRGVAVELAIDLANSVGADPWLTVPSGASDAYFDQLADVVAQRLHPDRRVYLEHGALDPLASAPGLASAVRWSVDERAQRTRALARVFRARMGARAVVVAACRMHDLAECERVVDGARDAIQIVAVNPMLSADDSVDDVIERVKSARALAERRSLRLAAYAGSAPAEKLKAFLTAWEKAGGGLFVHDALSVGGEPGPKFRALVAFSRTIAREQEVGGFVISTDALSQVTKVMVDEFPVPREADGSIRWQGKAGARLVVAERADGVVGRTIVDVQSGKMAEARLVFPEPLPPSPPPIEPLASRWWFWTAVAGAAVLGGVTTMLLVAGDESGPGTAEGAY